MTKLPLSLRWYLFKLWLKVRFWIWVMEKTDEWNDWLYHAPDDSIRVKFGGYIFK